MNSIKPLPEVLTVKQAADFLQLTQQTIRRMARDGVFPGRCVGQDWRFLKAVLEDWLRGRDSRAVLLQQAGALADDDTLPALRKAIYAARGRPETEDGADA